MLIIPNPAALTYSFTFSSELLTDSKTLEIGLNAILLSFSIPIRTFIFIRAVLLGSEFMGPRATRVSDIFGHNPTYMFAIRCLQLENPIKFLSFTFCYSTCMWAYIL